MSKKMIIILTALMLTVSGAGLAVAAELTGEVTEVKGKTVTIEVKGKASDLSVGDSVEIKSEGKKKAPKKGGDMLMGC
jgi:uncharacterized protein YxeA